MNKSSFLTMFAWIGPIIGPVLLIIRGGNASAIEKFCYVTMIGPLALLAVSLRYAMSRKSHLEEEMAGYRKLFIIVGIATCVSASTAAWLIFRG